MYMNSNLFQIFGNFQEMKMGQNRKIDGASALKQWIYGSKLIPTLKAKYSLKKP